MKYCVFYCRFQFWKHYINWFYDGCAQMVIFSLIYIPEFTVFQFISELEINIYLYLEIELYKYINTFEPLVQWILFKAKQFYPHCMQFGLVKKSAWNKTQRSFDCKEVALDTPSVKLKK